MKHSFFTATYRIRLSLKFRAPAQTISNAINGESVCLPTDLRTDTVVVVDGTLAMVSITVDHLEVRKMTVRSFS